MEADERPHLFGGTTDDRKFKTVAPLVRNAAGKYEQVLAVIYTADGMPVELLIATDSKVVPVAEWEPMENL